MEYALYCVSGQTEAKSVCLIAPGPQNAEPGFESPLLGFSSYAPFTTAPLYFVRITFLWLLQQLATNSVP